MFILLKNDITNAYIMPVTDLYVSNIPYIYNFYKNHYIVSNYYMYAQ